MRTKIPKKQVSERLTPIASKKAPQSLSVFAAGGEIVESNQYQALALRSMFWKPDYLDPSGSAWVEHLPFAFWVVEALHPGLFVELGTHNGHSYFSFCQAIKRLGLNTPSYAVDTWRGDDHAGHYDEAVFQQVSSYNQSHYREFSSLLRCTFDEAVARFADGTIDLLHIDGFHTYEVVRHDFETWLPKLSNKAVVLFHDTNVREGSFGVHKFFSQISKNYPHFEFIHGHGLGVLGVGANQSSMLSTLFECYSHQPSRNIVYELFSRLGSYCHDGMDLNTERRNFSTQSGRIAELDRTAQESAARISQLEQLGSERALEIDRLNGDVAKVNAEKQALEGRIAVEEAQGAQIRLEFERGIVGRDSRILQLEQLGSERAVEIERLNGEVEKVNAEKQALESRIAEGEAQSAARIAHLEQEGTASAAEVERLNAEVAKVNAEKQALEGRIAEGEAQSTARISQLEELGCERAVEIERLGGEVEKVNAEKQALESRIAVEEAQSAARIGQLEQLGSERAVEIERLNRDLENAQANIRERFEELAKLTCMLIDTQRDRDRFAAENSELAARFEDFKAETAEAEAQSAARISQLEQLGSERALEIDRLQGEIANAQANIGERFEELAKLTRLYIDAEENGKKLAAAWRQQCTPTVFGEATLVGKAEGGEFQHIEYSLKDIQHLGRQFRGVQARIINHRGDAGIVIFEPNANDRAFYGWEKSGDENGRGYMLIIPKNTAGREALFAATTNDLLLLKAIVLEIAVQLAQNSEEKNSFWLETCQSILDEFEALPTRLHYDDVKVASKQGNAMEAKMINPSWKNHLIFQDTVSFSGKKIMAILDQKGRPIPDRKQASRYLKEIFDAYQKETKNLLFHIFKEQ